MSETKHPTLGTLLQSMTLKDFFLILAFLGIGSNEAREWIRDDPQQTQTILETQTSVIEKSLGELQLTLAGHSEAISTLSSAIVDNRYRIEEVNDSLAHAIMNVESTLLTGLANIDGYFDARFDSLFMNR